MHRKLTKGQTRDNWPWHDCQWRWSRKSPSWHCAHSAPPSAWPAPPLVVCWLLLPATHTQQREVMTVQNNKQICQVSAEDHTAQQANLAKYPTNFAYWWSENYCITLLSPSSQEPAQFHILSNYDDHRYFWGGKNTTKDTQLCTVVLRTGF